MEGVISYPHFLNFVAGDTIDKDARYGRLIARGSVAQKLALVGAVSRPDLSSADLSSADLSGADLSDADLSSADLRDADLRGGYLSGADLSSAHFGNANLFGVHLSGANLTGAQGVSNEQLQQEVSSLQGATMPNGHKYEDWIKDRESRKEAGQNE